VVSKEEVAAGRKVSGGAWGPTSRNAGLAGPAPQNGRWSNTGKKQAKMSIAGLSVAIWWSWEVPSRNQAANIKDTFQRRPTTYEQLKALSVLV
jgi:hypothetical protein